MLDLLFGIFAFLFRLLLAVVISISIFVRPKALPHENYWIAVRRRFGELLNFITV